ncbi:MAG: arginase family protein, partial [Deltaproteobacteria bacterium]|nr:arginase family protein [Deltaproteobacteria bacterium]
MILKSGPSMENGTPKRKIFGVALDASDDPISLHLKLGSMMAREKGDNHWYADPYDALIEKLPHGPHLEYVGKFPVPSWLGPRPLLSDRPLVHSENFQRFYDEKGFLKISQQVKDFVTEKILPDTPVMIGIDHSATGGVLSALSEHHGAENISVVVLDQHFDALPASLRTEAGLRAHRNLEPDMITMPFGTLGSDEYCCGNFWAYLMDDGALLPENLSFIGVADYPRED